MNGEFMRASGRSLVNPWDAPSTGQLPPRFGPNALQSFQKLITPITRDNAPQTSSAQIAQRLCEIGEEPSPQGASLREDFGSNF